jgi:hypothetical protein
VIRTYGSDPYAPGAKVVPPIAPPANDMTLAVSSQPHVEPLGPTTHSQTVYNQNANPRLRVALHTDTTQAPNLGDLTFQNALTAGLADPLRRAPKVSPFITIPAQVAGSMIPGMNEVQTALGGDHVSPGMVALDAASFFPFLKAGRAVTDVAEGVKAARSTGSILDKLGTYKPRTLVHNDLAQQLPKARSRITNVGERLTDKASVALQNSPHVVNVPGARLMTAGDRVAKAAGRSQRLERGRTDAALAEHFKAIKAVKPGSSEDVANFWYAQMPKAYRNAEGLSLVRAKQAEELQRLTSGKALEGLTAREGAIKAKMAKVEDPKLKLPMLKDLEEMKILKTDLPQRATDTAASIGQLDKVIAEAPAANDAAINAVHALGNVREPILVKAGRLQQQQASARKGLVSRWLGLEPTGEEAYLGHRMANPESFRGSYAPTGGTGRAASPKGVGSPNKLVLATNGRLRPSLHVAAEDHASAQVFHQANIARSDLGNLGTPFRGFVPQGHVLVNPRGRTIPAHWKTDELAQFSGDYGDTEQIRAKAKEIVDGFIGSDPSGWERVKNDALANGVSWDELRVLPARLKDRYYAQFRSAKGRGTALKAYDTGIDAVATSIVFARLGYIPKNFVQNLIMAAPHQGPMLLVNATRAAQVMADSKLRPFMQAEVGHTGPTGSLGSEMFSQKVIGKIVGGVGKVADDPIRFSAFMHEAAAAGVVSRVNPLLGEKDKQALFRLFTDKAQRPLLNDIRSRAVEAMADFSRMTPDQSKIARRFLIIPGWLMAGTRYPFHFAATHPVRSALLAYIAMGEPGAPDSLHFNKPVNEYIHGSGYKQGIDTPWGRERLNSISPVSTPWDLGLAAVGTIRGKTGPFDFNTPTVFDSVQPLAGAGIGIAQGQGIKKSLQRLAPGEQFVEQMIHPNKNPKNYPEDRTRWGRLKREIGVLPINVTDNGSSPSGGTSYHSDPYSGGGNTYSKDPYK